MDIFLTGDRQIPAQLAVLPVGATLLGKLFELNGTGEKLRIATGDNVGVEAAVRSIIAEFDGELLLIPTPTGADGKPDWAARAELVKERELKVVVIHGAPESSSMLKPMLGSDWDDAELEIVGI